MAPCEIKAERGSVRRTESKVYRLNIGCEVISLFVIPLPFALRPSAIERKLPPNMYEMLCAPSWPCVCVCG